MNQASLNSKHLTGSLAGGCPPRKGNAGAPTRRNRTDSPVSSYRARLTGD